jgi:phage baseplate assembly protein W
MENNNIGIKYPFTRESNKKTYVDTNSTYYDAIKSRVLHTILTPKGQRIRMPNFGTDLIKYIFEPSEDLTYDGIRNEIVSSLSQYVPEVTFKDINVSQIDGDTHKVIALIKYSIKEGDEEIITEVAVSL